MSDKLRRVFPISISFADGEQPTGKKLNALATQSRNGLGIVERAVGDLWGQSGEDLLADHKLQLTNLARMVGKNKLLNPAIFPTIGASNVLYNDDLSINYLNQTEGYLQFKPKDGTVYSAVTIVNDGSGCLGAGANRKTNEYEVTASGNWWIDTATGRFRTATPIPSSTQIRYQIDPPNEWLRLQEALPGVIPDPQQTTYSGLKFESATEGYLVYLPPREYITPDDDRQSPTNWPNSSHYANNQSTSAHTFFLWQDPTLSALAGQHFHYALPKELYDQWSSIAAGVRLPDGFMYLWDQANERIIEDAVFYKSTSSSLTYVFRIECPSLDLASLASATQTSADYNKGYSLIVPGASLASSVWNLHIQFLKHAHNNLGDFSPQVNHSELLGLNPPTYFDTEFSHNTKYPTHVPGWLASQWKNDHHVYLLAREGAQTDTARKRDNYNNAMLGHLLLANADTSGADNFLDSTVPNNSFRIYFGNVDGKSLYLATGNILSADAALNITPGTATAAGGTYGLQVIGQNGFAGNGGRGALITGGTGSAGNNGGDGGYFTAGAGGAGGTAGYGLVASAAASGTLKAALRVVPQAANPSGSTAGDIFVSSTSNKLKIYNGTTWNPLVQAGYQNGDGTADSITGATEQAFSKTYTLPAGLLVAGSTLRIRAWGLGASSAVLRIRLGTGSVTAHVQIAVITLSGGSSDYTLEGSVYIIDSTHFTSGGSGIANNSLSAAYSNTGSTPNINTALANEIIVTHATAGGTSYLFGLIVDVV